MTMLGTASVLGVLAAAEAALNYPGFKYALPAPETPGVIGALLLRMPAFAAISVGGWPAPWPRRWSEANWPRPTAG